MNYELKILFGKSDGGVMGKDCALMEIVPCKSKGCQGNNAKLSNGKTCIEDFTDRFVKPNLNVMLNDKERLIVFVGKQSCKVWYDLLKQYCGGAHYTFNDIWENHKNELFNVQGTKVRVVFAPHPSNGHNSLNKYSGIRGSQSTMTF